MLSCTRRRRTVFACLFLSLGLLLSLVPVRARAQDDGSDAKPEKHGRKYKAPPDTSHIEVTVIRDANKKPLVNAAVIFHPVASDGKDEGFLEMKTDPDGKAVIDVIPTGSAVRIQVIATGFATYAQDYQIDEASRSITIALIKPRAQVSTYIDESGKPAAIQPGVQEPPPIKRPAPSGSTSGSSGSGGTTTPDSSSGSGSKPQP